VHFVRYDPKVATDHTSCGCASCRLPNSVKKAPASDKQNLTHDHTYRPFSLNRGVRVISTSFSLLDAFGVLTLLAGRHGEHSFKLLQCFTCHKFTHSDLHSVWWSWRHVVDQFPLKLSETCSTGLLISDSSVELHFFGAPLRSHWESRCIHCETTLPGWAGTPAVRNLVLWTLKVGALVSWWKPTGEVHLEI